MALPKYEASFRRVYKKYKARAKTKGIGFTLSQEDFKAMAEKNCAYCDAKPLPSTAKYHKECNGAWAFNGLDRIDNNRGYVYGNVQPCCNLCNQLKSNLTEKDFLDQIQSIIAHRREGIKDD